MSIAPEQAGIGIRRHFTIQGVHPYDVVEWERRHAKIENHKDGTVAFEQRDVEFPKSWSLNASNIVAQKYFRGKQGTPERENSLKQVIDRVADTITGWGIEHGYFTPGESQILNDELKYILVNQLGSFNSPVWFNIGAAGRVQQASACFILDVVDSMESIKEWVVTEADIFRGGSGSGANLSLIREDGALLSRGGKASGPVSFMRWADSGAGAIKSAGETRRAAKMVILNADHPDIEDFIWCKAREERKSRVLRDEGYDMDLDGKDTHSVQYQNANNSVRVTDEFMNAVVDDGDWNLISRADGSITKTIKARQLMRQIAEATWESADPGMQYHTTVNLWNTTPILEELDGSNPCVEHMRRRNSSCNLASLNLLKFLGEDGVFDLESYQAAIDIVFTAMDILICGGEFPTEKIKQVTHADRDLGIGYSNLGALLMALGLPYDSDKGRAYAGLVTGLLTGGAYCQSAKMAAKVGPFPSFAGDREGCIKVMRQHLEAAIKLEGEVADLQIHCGKELARANTETWNQVVDGAMTVGLRNAQASVLAPTGTISFMMDCDTTGGEPDLGLCKTKKLVGGGTMNIVNQTVPRALRRMGYTDKLIGEANGPKDNRVRTGILGYIDEHKTIIGAPGFNPEHLPVFACSMGDNAIGHMGHLGMMAAMQPFISGAISKTVNVPETVTVEEVEQLHIDAWRMGLKAVAFYRDGSKVAQPLSATKSDKSAAIDLPERIVEHVIVKEPVREKLPRKRLSYTTSFRVGDAHGYLTVGEYPDGRPGEIFLKVAKQGSTLAGMMDAFAIAVSHGLQYGVPLQAFVDMYSSMRFEPSGITDDPEIYSVNSIIDHVFRRLALDYLSIENREGPAIFTKEEKKQMLERQAAGAVEPASLDSGLVTMVQPQPAANDAPYCYQCGNVMQRAGSCYVCGSCGTTSGCS